RDRGELSPTAAGPASGRTITESRRPSKGGRLSSSAAGGRLEPGGPAGGPVRARPPPHVAAGGEDVVLLVVGLDVLDRDLLAVPDRAEASAAERLDHAVRVPLLVQDLRGPVAPLIGQVEELRLRVDHLVDRPLDVARELASLIRAARGRALPRQVAAVGS